jgi:hypothetical protein
VATESLVEVLIWNWRRFDGRDGGRIEKGLGAEDEKGLDNEDEYDSDSDVEELYDFEDSYSNDSDSDGSDDPEECKCKCRLFFFDRENLDLGLRFPLACLGFELRVIEYLFLDE